MSVSATELMELVNYQEQKNGDWKATLEVPGVKLMLKAPLLSGVTKSMQELCETLAAKLQAQAADAKQADRLIRKIVADGKPPKARVSNNPTQLTHERKQPIH